MRSNLQVMSILPYFLRYKKRYLLTLLFISLTTLVFTVFKKEMNADSPPDSSRLSFRKIQQSRNGARHSPDRLPLKMIDISNSKKIKELRAKRLQLASVKSELMGSTLTDDQKKTLAELTVEEKEVLLKKVKMMEFREEQQQLENLRNLNYIQEWPNGGGEHIIMNPGKAIRFPRSLKRKNPEDWPNDYKIYYNMTYYPWYTDEICKDYFTSFAPPHRLKNKALASFPASGNSWLRYLIDCGTGIFTGSMYDDSSLTKKGLFGEAVSYDAGMTILQKTHGYTTGSGLNLPHTERLELNHMKELNNEGILLIRNPFEALISHRHLDAGGHTGYAPDSHFIGKDWEEFVSLKIKLWKEFNIDWLSTPPNAKDVHVVFYEEVKQIPVKVVREIINFLSLPLDEGRLSCMGNQKEGPFKRGATKNKVLKMNPFTEALKSAVYNAIDEVNYYLVHRGKESLPTDKYLYYDLFEARFARDEGNSN